MVRCKLYVALASAMVLVGCTSSPVKIVPPNIAPGGRALSVAVALSNTQRLVVATETGGLFRTFDGGKNWQHLDGLPNFRIIDVAIASLAPDTIIATALPQYRVVNDGGIWRSTDGGASWMQATNWTPPAGFTCSSRPGAFGISHMPLTHTFFVGTDCGLAVSNDDGASWSPVPGIDTRIRSVLVLSRTAGVAASDSSLFFLNSDGAWTQSQSIGTPGPAVTHSFAAPWFAGKSSIFFLAAGGNTLWLSTDGGATWASQSAPSNQIRESFVRIGRSLANDDSKFELYWGDGQNLHRKTFALPGPKSAGDWVDLHSDHPDPSDIAFDSEFRVPVLLTTDGGVHVTSDRGSSWVQIGGGQGGFVALQIAELKGALAPGDPPLQFLYFGTQDNDLKASSDGGRTWKGTLCCEGRFISATSVRVTASACGPCSNKLTDPGFQNRRGWYNPPHGGSGDHAPFLLSGDAYLQAVTNTDNMPPSFDFWVTTNGGSSWSQKFSLQFAPIGATVVPGPVSNPTAYQGFQKPGSISNGGLRFGLLRATDLFAQGSTRLADGDGTVAFGSLHTPIARYLVVGADRQVPDHLIAADADNQEMKYSADGGATWFSLPQLTQAITSNGEYKFELSELTLASVVAWDSFDSCHILVGTLQNGIFRSIDGGNTWQQIAGSKVVPNVTSFYFPPTGLVWVSTNGRGLWTLDLGRNGGITHCTIPRPPSEGSQQNTTLATDVATGASHEFKGLSDRAVCSDCTVIVVRNGWVTNIENSDRAIRAIAISGGTLYQLNRFGKEAPLGVPNTYRPEDGKLNKVIPPNAAPGGRRIRALVLQGNQLRFVIGSRGELPFAPQRTPMLFLYSASRLGSPSVASGETVRAVGTNFLAASRSAGPVRISFDEKVVAERVPVRADGSFSVDIPVQHLPGEIQATAEQQDGNRLTITTAIIDVIAQDTAQ